MTAVVACSCKFDKNRASGFAFGAEQAQCRCNVLYMYVRYMCAALFVDGWMGGQPVACKWLFPGGVDPGFDKSTKKEDASSFGYCSPWGRAHRMRCFWLAKLGLSDRHSSKAGRLDNVPPSP